MRINLPERSQIWLTHCFVVYVVFEFTKGIAEQREVCRHVTMVAQCQDQNNMELKQRRRRRQRERQKSNKFRQQSKNFACDHAFLYVSQPTQRDYDVKLPNSTRSLYKLGEQHIFFLFFLNLNTVLSDLTPENLANI